MKFFIYMILFVLLTACNTESSKQSTVPLSIAVESAWVGYIHIIIAQEKGFFEQHQAHVKLVLGSNSPNTEEFYKTKKADGLLNVLADNIILNADGFPTQVVMVIDSSFSADAIVASPKIKTVSDLVNKTVSFEELNSFSHLFVVKTLAKAGLKEGQFEAKTILGTEAFTALQAGQVDAAYIYEPTLSQALDAGFHVIAKAGDIPGLITDVLAFRETVVQQRPEQIQRTIAAILDARDYVAQHPEESLAIFAKFNQATAQEFAAGFKGLHYPNLEDNYLALQPEGLIFKNSREIIDFYMEKGQIVKLPSLENMVNSDFIKQLSQK